MARTLVVSAFVVASTLFGYSASADRVPERSYPVEMTSGFESKVTLEEVEETALKTLSRPIEATIDPSGEARVATPLPAILRIVACRGADLPSVDPRVSPVDDEFVWYVSAQGTFTMPHFGDVYGEGYFLVDPRTGLFFRSGVFPAEK